MKKASLLFLTGQARRRGTADCSPLNESDPCHFRHRGRKTLAFFSPGGEFPVSPDAGSEGNMRNSAVSWKPAGLAGFHGFFGEKAMKPRLSGS
jgi:hypothetical protein